MSVNTQLPSPSQELESGGAIELFPWIAKHRHSNPTRAYALSKRALDVVAVLLVAPVVVPIVALAALAIKLESPGGSVLHSQQRTGFKRRRFSVYKLRSMVPDAEARKADLKHLNEREWPDFKVANDPRVLKCGKFFRKTSIDELPQLWNVLVGSMTLVGPRPTTLGEDSYLDWQLTRFTVQPGLTGLWQVTARDDPSFVLRTRLDLTYLSRRSLWLDLEILLRTVVGAIRAEGS